VPQTDPSLFRNIDDAFPALIIGVTAFPEKGSSHSHTRHIQRFHPEIMSLLPEHYPVKRTYDPGTDGAGLRPLLVKQFTGGSSPLPQHHPLSSQPLNACSLHPRLGNGNDSSPLAAPDLQRPFKLKPRSSSLVTP